MHSTRAEVVALLARGRGEDLDQADEILRTAIVKLQPLHHAVEARELERERESVAWRRGALAEVHRLADALRGGAGAAASR